MPKTRSHTARSTSSASPGPEAALHAIWTGTVSFSLVAIPVQVTKAVEPGRVSFRTLHRKDFSPLVRRMFCPKEQVPVPPEEMVRGYEIGPDHYIVVTDEELEAVAPERSRSIEITEFVGLPEIDPIYFDHPYYLVPTRGGEKSYRLLVEILARRHKAGLAKFVLHEREYFVAIYSAAGALALVTLHYSDEILSAVDIAPSAEIDPQAKARVKQGIAAMLADFDPSRYADQRREKIAALLKKKIKEKNPVTAPEAAAPEGEGPADLIAALEESMRQVKQGR